MDGVHDLGGKPGFGRVDKSGAGKVFHARWEAGVFAMVRACAAAGVWAGTDRFRHAIERIDPRAYLNHGYYGRWLGGLETLLVEAGMIDQAEVTSRARARGATATDLVAARPAPDPDPRGPEPAAPGSARDTEAGPRFAVGDRVLTVSHAVPGHTRLPAYARGRQGEVIAWHGGWVFPDTNAHGRGEQPRHLYTVRFTAEALWRRSGFSVCLDLFEPYLQTTKGDPNVR